MPGNKTWAEIASQPRVLRAAIDEVSRLAPQAARLFSDPAPDEVVLTGCGSSYYLALSAASIFSKILGLPARAVPASELVLYPETVFPRPGTRLVIGISRSGETSETVAALKAAAAFEKSRTMSVSCTREAEISSVAGFHLALPESDEASVVMTRSFTSMLLALQFLVSSVAGTPSRLNAIRRVPEIVEEMMKKNAGLIEELARKPGVKRFVFLGSGPAYGVACEGALKMTEMALETAQAFHTLEFRHGPKSVVDGCTLVVSIPSDVLGEQERSLLEELRGFSGYIVTLGNPLPCAQACLDVPFGGLDEWDRVVATTVPLQMLAYFRATARGLDPDNPKHLSQVVKIEIEAPLQGSGGRGSA